MSDLHERWPVPASKRLRTRRTLLLAAHEVFSVKSVERASVEEIAAIADMSVGSVYSHFGSKDNLAVAYLDGIFDLLDEDLAKVRTQQSPIRRVLAAGEAYLQHVIDFPAASRMASVRAAYPAEEHMDDAARQLDRRMVTTLMGVAADLKASMDDGEIPASPIEQSMIFIWGAWHGVATSVARCDHLTIPPELAHAALARGRRLLLAGLDVPDLPDADADADH